MINQSTVVFIVGAGVAGLAAFALAQPRPTNRPNGQNLPANFPHVPLRFTNENITHRFTTSLPEMVPALNLELAICKQVETFTQVDELQVCWGMLDLGTNVVQVSVPVTYRFHVQIKDIWKLEIQGNRVIVHAPVLRPSQPPAIHTDELQRLSQRGWARCSPTEMLEKLERNITPTLIGFAGDPRRIDLVRDTCRYSVAEFVQYWLQREKQWGGKGFTQIQVKFADEAALPPTVTLKALTQ